MRDSFIRIQWMILLLLAAFVLVPVAPLASQTAKHDSLIAMLQHTGDKKERIRLCMDIAMAYPPDQHEQALPYAKEALQLAEEQDTQKAIADACFTLGRLYYRWGKKHEADSLYRRSAALRRECGDTAGLAEALSQLIPITLSFGKSAEALQYAEEVSVLQTQSEDTTRIIAALLSIASCHQRLQSYDSAIVFSERGLELARRSADTTGMVNTLHRISQVSRAADDLPMAAVYGERAVALCNTSERRTLASRVWFDLGWTYQRMQRFADAVDRFQNALNIFLELDQVDMATNTLISMAPMYFLIGDTTGSLASLERALELSKEAKLPTSIGTSLFSIGRHYDAIHDYPRAIRFFREGVEEIRSFANKNLLTQMLYIFATTLTRNKEYAEAERVLLENLDLMKEIGNFTLEAKTLGCLGYNSFEAGDNRNAIEYHKMAVAKAASDRQPSELATQYYSLASAYKRIGEVDSAVICYDSVLAISKPHFLNAWNFPMYALRELKKISLAQGDYAKAFEQEKTYLIVQDSIRARQNRKQFTELTMRFETERMQNQIELMEKDRQIGDMELARRSEELEQQQLRARQQQQAITLLESDREIRRLELARQQSELELNSSTLALNHAEIEKKQRELDLQSATLARETLLRYALLTGALLFLFVAGLVLRNLRDKRRASAIQAETAEYKARAAAAEAHALQAESERMAREAQQAFSKQLIAEQEQERKRIAGALHDSIGQDLLIIKHRAIMALDERPSEVAHLRDILEVSSAAINDVRRMSRELRPYQLERVGLTTTLRSMLQAVAERTMLEIKMEIEDVDGLIVQEREIDLYRVVQEGVNNIINHAEASTAEITLRRVNGTLLLTIGDNGKGFDPGVLPRDAEAHGIGLQGMAARIRMLGGNLNLNSVPTQGTILQASIPVANLTASVRNTEMEMDS